MRPWFTTEQLAPDTWVISEYRHWEETHCYLLIGADRALLIDTGLGICKFTMKYANSPTGPSPP